MKKTPENMTVKGAEGTTATAAKAAVDPLHKSLNDLVAESNNPECLKLKNEIDALRNDRRTLIKDLRNSRRRLEYKNEEFAALSKLMEMEKGRMDANRKEIGHLKYQKRKLEFMIETEASSLASEKEIIRKINDVDAKLNEALKSARLEKKIEYIKRDIEQYGARSAELDGKLRESDKALDDLYLKLRDMLGIDRKKQREREREKDKKRVHKTMEMPEINLEDIAVITKKEAKVAKGEDEQY